MSSSVSPGSLFFTKTDPGSSILKNSFKNILLGLSEKDLEEYFEYPWLKAEMKGNTSCIRSGRESFLPRINKTSDDK